MISSPVTGSHNLLSFLNKHSQNLNESDIMFYTFINCGDGNTIVVSSTKRHTPYDSNQILLSQSDIVYLLNCKVFRVFPIFKFITQLFVSMWWVISNSLDGRKLWYIWFRSSCNAHKSLTPQKQWVIWWQNSITDVSYNLN